MDPEVGQFLVDYAARYGDYTHCNSDMNTRTVVFIEGRSNFWTRPVLLMTMRILGPRWNLRVYETNRNAGHHDKVLTGWHVDRTRLDVDNISIDTYNQLLTNKSFWESIPEEHIMLVQTDSLVVRPVPNELLQLDYVGAPCGPEGTVLNGGTCLRRRSAMLRVLQQYKDEFEAAPTTPEDIVFSRVMRAHKDEFRLPEPKEAVRFFTESHLISDHNKMLVGVHGTNKGYLNSTAYKRMLCHIKL